MNTYKIISAILIIASIGTMTFWSTTEKCDDAIDCIVSSDAGSVVQPPVSITTNKEEINVDDPSTSSDIFIPEGNQIARINYDNNKNSKHNNIFRIAISNLPSESEKVWLEYDLLGMEDYTCIPHSINDNLAKGGYFQKKSNAWTHQKEQIPASDLKKGINIVRFTAPSSPDFRYIVKNLKITIENDNHNTRKLVINQPSTAYYFKKLGYVQGFIQGPGSESAVISIQGKQIPTFKGTFEQLVTKSDKSSDIWSVPVVVTFTDGEIISSEITFINPVDGELLTENNKVINFIECNASTEGSFDLHLNGMCLNADKNSSIPDAKISVVSLRDIDFPMMDEAMVNVTEKAGGYRCLPHGTNFGKEILISMEYDPGRLPQGYTPHDIYTFYFDETSKHWIALQRDTIDFANNIIISRTSHFTDFINGIIKVPESPLTQAYTPTSIKDIKAANPLEGMSVIQPPTANNMGNVKLNYPLNIPAGRKGMQPQLALQYTSGGENGWLGLGWNISIPSISVETRWGVPHYNSYNESETYVINGEQVTTKDAQGNLNKLPHRGDWVTRMSGSVAFYPRVEGSFDSIIRHGTNPKNYWWEVIDRNGTRSFYGKMPNNNHVDSTAVLTDDAGNIAYWGLTETRDLNDNTVRYYYHVIKDAGVFGSSNIGKQLYISEIGYTGHGSVKGLYWIEFQRYDKSVYQRDDVNISARFGFKEVTADLLKSISIHFKDSILRKYYFAYSTGEFNKQLLCAMYEWEPGDYSLENVAVTPDQACSFLRNQDAVTAIKVHIFDYYNDYNTASPNFQPFGDEHLINTYDDIPLDWFKSSSAINQSKTKQWGIGGSLTLGFGINPILKTLTLGGYYNYNASKSMDLNVALMDIDGDGLPDKVFSENGEIHYRKQLGGSIGNYHFAPNSVKLSGPSTFLYQESESDAWGGQATFGPASGSYQAGTTTSTTSIYFSDVNGDGFPDIVNNENVYFNQLNSLNVPEFKLPLNDTIYISNSSCHYTVYSGNVNDSVTITNDKIQMIKPKVVPFDAVRMWVAPFNGMISIDASIQLIEDKSEARLISKKVDGVRYTIQHGGVELFQDTIGASDYSLKVPGNITLNSLEVQKGDSIFFRLQSRNCRSFDNVIWDPVITYLDSTSQKDANKKDNFQYTASKDFVLEQDRTIGMPLPGTVKISGSIIKPALSDTICVQILKDNVVAFQRTYNGAEVINELIDTTYTNVDSASLFKFRVFANTNVDWSAVKFTPYMYIIPDNPLYPDTNEDGSHNFEFYPSVHHTMYPNPIFISRPYRNLGNITLTPYLSFSQNTINGHTIFSIKRPDGTIIKRFLTITNGAIVNPPSISLQVLQNDTVYFEFHSDDTTLMYKAINAMVNVVGGNPMNAGLHTLYPEELLKFGSLYRGWGQFTYNNDTLESTDPIDPSLLVYDATMSNTAGMTTLPDTSNFSSFTAGFNNLYNPLNVTLILMSPDMKNSSYVGYGDITTIKSDTIINYRKTPDIIKLDDPIIIPINPDKPVRTVRKQTVASNDSYCFGMPGISSSFTESDNELTMDYFDMNGDRFPDIIGPEYSQVTTPQGGLSDQMVSHYYYFQNPSNFSTCSSSGGTFGTSYMQNFKVPGNNVKSSKFSTSGQASGSASIGDGYDKTDYSWLDVNGDGLPDKLHRNGTVSMNLGYKFLPNETWNFTSIRAGNSHNSGLSFGTCNFNICNMSFSGGLGGGKSTNYTSDVIQDINGDGLVDRLRVDAYGNIKVNFNSGNKLLNTLVNYGNFDLSNGISYNKSFNIAVTYGISFMVFILPVKVCINPSYNNGSATNSERVQISDMNGDGNPDYVTSSDEEHITVRYSNIRRTNLIKSVENFLGGYFKVDYMLTNNNVDMPQRSWVMNSLSVYDGFFQDGPDSSLYTFEYDSGYYSRYERQSFGFRSVKTNQLDSTVNKNVYRSTIEKFHNNSYVFKNLKYYELTVDGDNHKFIENTYKYDLKEIASGVAIPASNPECYGEGFPAISQEDKLFYDGLNPVQIQTRKRFIHGSFGNIASYYDDGDLADNFDNVYANITYHPDPYSTHNISSPRSIKVYSGSTLYRHRMTEINPNNGLVVKVWLYNGANSTDYLMGYNDTYGNISYILYPTNLNNESLMYFYTYDTILNTYPVTISDNLGYTCNIEYDYKFGKVTSNRDITGNHIKYSYDNRGRINNIQGPVEYKNNNPYTIKFRYWDYYGKLFWDSKFDTIPWAKTYHYDPADPTNSIVTVLFADAQGKILQTKKNISHYNISTSGYTELMAVSGRVYYDEFGRTVKNYYPITESMGNDSILNLSNDVVNSSGTTYDILDRPLLQVKPDGTITSIQYGFALDTNSIKRFSTIITDANFISTRILKDQSDKQLEIRSPQKIVTRFEYDPVGQLVESIDPEHNPTTYEYDMLGRRTKRIHPDAGTTSYTYDNAGNIITLQTENLYANSEYITYNYYYNKLMAWPPINRTFI